MKILMVNKFFYIKGGSETYYFALRRLLERRGHQVIDFSMQDERNFESPTSRFFVTPADYQQAGGLKNQARMAANIIYSREAKQRFAQLVAQEKPDLVHLHLFQHQLSPSILDVVRRERLPAVYTAHDLKLVCLNYKMMHHGRLCEDCRGGSYLPCLRNRCVKESLLKSAVNVAEGYVHRLRRSYDAIDAIITPSEFYRRKFSEFGVAPERMRHIPNFLEGETPRVTPREDREQYYLYFGRLSEEKGVATLLRAAEGTSLRVLIAGTGPLQAELEEQVRARGLHNVRLLGFRSGQELTDLVGNARAVILPSEWYENGPYSAIEALQLGRPIIGADIGGIPELVQGSGMLFRPGDAQALRSAMQAMDALPGEAYRAMQNAARSLFERVYTEETHYQQLMQVYQLARERKAGR